MDSNFGVKNNMKTKNLTSSLGNIVMCTDLGFILWRNVLMMQK
jgi:hypothetical protein